MTTITVGAAVPFGFVRAVFSRRCKGHALPVELVRVHLRAVAKLAISRAKYRRKYEEKGRVSAAFADYLVTDGEQEEPAFSARRDYWRGFVGRRGIGVTGPRGGEFDSGLRDGFDNNGIDAPVFVAAGAMRCVQGSISCQSLSVRAGWIV